MTTTTTTRSTTATVYVSADSEGASQINTRPSGALELINATGGRQCGAEATAGGLGWFIIQVWCHTLFGDGSIYHRSAGRSQRVVLRSPESPDLQPAAAISFCLLETIGAGRPGQANHLRHPRCTLSGRRRRRHTHLLTRAGSDRRRFACGSCMTV